jgi:hypothetical protein
MRKPYAVDEVIQCSDDTIYASGGFRDKLVNIVVIGVEGMLQVFDQEDNLHKIVSLVHVHGTRFPLPFMPQR